MFVETLRNFKLLSTNRMNTCFTYAFFAAKKCYPKNEDQICTEQKMTMIKDERTSSK